MLQTLSVSFSEGIRRYGAMSVPNMLKKVISFSNSDKVPSPPELLGSVIGKAQAKQLTTARLVQNEYVRRSSTFTIREFR